MKNIVMIFVILILSTACGRNPSNNQNVDTNDDVSDYTQQEFMVKADEKINRIFPEDIDLKKQGVEMVHNYFPMGMTKGEDGCYYFRKEKDTEKNEKIVFYKNNGQKVCETEMPLELQKKGYDIYRFVQYQDYFFVELSTLSGEPEEYEDYLSAIHIENGKWEKIIEDPGLIYQIFVYEDSFICVYSGEIVIYTLLGEKENYHIEEEKGAYITIESVVDGKIYYFYEAIDDESEKEVLEVKRCDLDGKNNELIFRYQYGDAGSSGTKNLRLENQYIYLLTDGTLFRIPLYNGKIEKISDRNIARFDISDTYIFFLNRSDWSLYKIRKDLSSEPVLVEKSAPCTLDAPFICAGDHIMLKECDQDQEDLVTNMAKELPYIDIEYVNDYSWMTEEGVVEYTIRGIHLSEKQYKEYKTEIGASCIL